MSATGIVSEQERLARCALSRVAEPGDWAVDDALMRGPATEVWAALKAGAPLGNLGQRALDGMALRIKAAEPERDLERLEAAGGRLLCPGDEEWPDGLEWQDDVLHGDIKQMAPPWALFVRGPAHLRRATQQAVSVVGARASTAYGNEVAHELAFELAQAGVTVVSGAAYGIDGAAHRGALAAEAAPTVAVLACGVDRAYPSGHTSLLAEIACTGLIVSEWPPGSSVTRTRFLVRNRVVAALSRGTVVVESALRSGSHSTASRALELGRSVMAVPGPVTSRMSAGGHQLVRDQKAVLVTDASEVLELASPTGQNLLAPKRGTVHPRDALQEQARRVLDALPVRTPMGVARVAAAAGVSALVVQQVLPALLLAGLAEQRDGGWRLTALGAAP